MGAEVIKIEPPWGDSSRMSPQYPEIKGLNSYFLFVNRNKKSIGLNLKSEKGVEILKKLIQTSDVLVENFRPGVMDRLGVGYDELNKINPKIIYASISGFGQDSLYAKRPSFDIIAQAMSGWMWLNSREPRSLNSMPSFIQSCLAASPGDTIPGTFCALSILAALIHRNTTGEGQRIDIAQTDSLITILGLALTRYLFTGITGDEKAHQERTIIHGVYEAKDGFMVLRAIGERDLNALADVVGVNANDLNPSSTTLIKWFRERTRAEISELLGDKIPCAPVLDEKELVQDPNVKGREMIVELDHPWGFTYRAVATGIKFSKTPVSVRTLPAELGRDTIQVLRGLGYDDKKISELSEENS
jgi:crotonobetainyl-CoA:carnitine CoA-transferase CaiB-like acyl-CoA transferase